MTTTSCKSKKLFLLCFSVQLPIRRQLHGRCIYLNSETLIMEDYNNAQSSAGCAQKLKLAYPDSCPGLCFVCANINTKDSWIQTRDRLVIPAQLAVSLSVRTSTNCGEQIDSLRATWCPISNYFIKHSLFYILLDMAI